MKSDELMIGDWVICYHPTCEPKANQVTAGLLKSLEQQDLGFRQEDSPLFRIVEPIPLTAEILEKNGFEKDRQERWLLSNYIFMQKYDFTKKYVIGIIKPYFEGIIDVRYVHELQYAMKLCGINKTIEL